MEGGLLLIEDCQTTAWSEGNNFGCQIWSGGTVNAWGGGDQIWQLKLVWGTKYAVTVPISRK